MPYINEEPEGDTGIAEMELFSPCMVRSTFASVELWNSWPVIIVMS